MVKRTEQVIDPEMIEFENALLRSVAQANCGEGRVTIPEQIKTPSESTCKALEEITKGK